ncbi:MAG: VOC family protein [Caulobacteraceae bacterium]
MSDEPVNLRYMVEDPLASADWYVEMFGFSKLPNSSPAFAAVEKGPLRLLLSGKMSSAGRAMPDGRQPVPGGWNRFQVIVTDIEAEVARLRSKDVKFLNDIVKGPGGQQILVEDPSGNIVEIFQSAGFF